MHTILIVGGSGFLGRSCLNNLSSHKISILGRKEKVASFYEENIKYYQLDIHNLRKVESFLKKNNFSHLLYLAWPSTLAHNALEHLFFSASTAQFLSAFSYYNYNARIVLAGSIHETGVTRGKILNDFENMKPNSLYGVGKKSVWDALNILKIKNVCWVRFSNIYGIGDHPEKVLSRIINGELSDEPFSLNHPYNIIDFVHINDAVRGVLSALCSEYSGVVNIGGGYGYSLNSIQDFVRSYIQEDEDITPLKPAEMGPILDIKNALEILDYKPSMGIEQSIKECIEFLKNEKS